MPIDKAEVVRTPESLISMPWVETNPAKVVELRDVAKNLGLVLLDPLVALRGGGILSLQEDSVPEAERLYLASDRKIAVIPARSSEDQLGPNRLVYFPTREGKAGNQFDANLAAYRGNLPAFIRQRQNAHELGYSPIPEAVQTLNIGDDQNPKFVTVTEYQPRIEGLGMGDSIGGMHELDARRLPIIDQIPGLLDALDATHVPSEEFQAWIKGQNIVLPKNSWLNPQNPLHALRGQEWWKNPDNTQNDRLKELKAKAMNHLSRSYIKTCFQTVIFPLPWKV